MSYKTPEKSLKSNQIYSVEILSDLKLFNLSNQRSHNWAIFRSQQQSKLPMDLAWIFQFRICVKNQLSKRTRNMSPWGARHRPHKRCIRAPGSRRRTWAWCCWGWRSSCWGRWTSWRRSPGWWVVILTLTSLSTVSTLSLVSLEPLCHIVGMVVAGDSSVRVKAV